MAFDNDAQLTTKTFFQTKNIHFMCKFDYISSANFQPSFKRLQASYELNNKTNKNCMEKSILQIESSLK